MTTSAVTVMLAPTSRVGRTSTVANAVWDLAVAGNRVLVVDADDSGAPVTDYLEPYRITVSQENLVPDPRLENALRSWYDERTGAAPFYGSRHAERPRTTHHRLPDGVSTIDVLTLPRTGLWARPPSPRTVHELRTALLTGPYDHVLIEMPTGSDEHTIADAAGLADHVVICLRALSSQISTARRLRAALLRTVSRLGLPRPRVSGIVTFLTPVDPREIDPIVLQVRGAFVPDPATASPACPGASAAGGDDAFCVPFRAVGANSPLDVLFPPQQRPGTGPGGPLPEAATAYARIARSVAAAPLPAAPAVPPGTRERYRRAVGPQGVTGPTSLSVVHRPVDRPLVEWIQDTLEPQEIRVRGVWRDEDVGALAAGSTVLLLEGAGEPAGTRIPEEAGDRIRVRWDRGPRTPQEQDASGSRAGGDPEVIDLRGLTEDVAGQVLARRLGLPAHGGPRSGPRFPPDRNRAVRRSFLPRNEDFVGRDGELDELREVFRSAPGLLVRTIHGPAGTGKSELAREYTHRFECAYDVVWWIEAADVSTVRRSLNDLGRDRSVRNEGDLARSALRELASTSDRWLLVYDGVTDPALLRDYLPARGRGHVLVTSRENLVPGAGGSRLGDLSNRDATDLLRRRARDLPQDPVEGLLRATGTHPVVVDLSSRWLERAVKDLRSKGYSASQACRWGIRELVERHRSPGPSTVRPPARTGPTAAGGPAVVGGPAEPAVVMLLGRLALDLPGRLATVIGRFCTHLSGQGVDVRLLSSPPMLEQLALACEEADAREFRADTALMHQALWTGIRLGLLDISWAQRVRLRARDLMAPALVAGLAPGERGTLRARVLRGLAGAAPTDAAGDDPGRAPRLNELGRHLEVCGAPDSDEDAVRLWVIRQVRHHFLTDDLQMQRAVLDLAVRTRERWAERSPEGDPALLRLGTQVANLYRGLGNYPEALRLDQEVIAAQRRDLGITHPRTLMTARGLAADLRGMGRFTDSLEEDSRTYRGLREVYGDDHLETLKAEHDLCLALGMAGRTEEAARRGVLVLKRVRRIQGVADPLAWQSATQLATVQRDLGRLEDALQVLQRAQEELHSSRKEPGQGFDLLLANGICVVKRDLGTWSAALMRHEEVLAGYLSLHGDDHNDVLACRLALAGHHHVHGRSGQAVRHAAECLERLETHRGQGHPFTATCRSSLGLFHRAAGETDRAVGLGTRAVQDLRDRLGTGHPWTIAARMLLAGSLAASGDPQRAEAVERELVRTCKTLLPSSHPYAVGCAGNLALTLGASGGQEGPGRGGAVERTDPLVEIPQT